LRILRPRCLDGTRRAIPFPSFPAQGRRNQNRDNWYGNGKKKNGTDATGELANIDSQPHDVCADRAPKTSIDQEDRDRPGRMYQHMAITHWQFLGFSSGAHGQLGYRKHNHMMSELLYRFFESATKTRRRFYHDSQLQLQVTVKSLTKHKFHHSNKTPYLKMTNTDGSFFATKVE
jgi:hypothetical protein